MLTKIERFGQWRGKKSDDEQSIIKSALLIGDYVHSVKYLDTIKSDLSDNLSNQYIAFNKYEERSYGVLLHCKLQIEEALDQIPVTGITERILLNDLKIILEEIYDNPRSNPSQKGNDLIIKTKKLLMLNSEHLADKKLAKFLCFDLYVLLNIVNLSLSQLTWWQEMAVKAVMDLNKMKDEVTILLRMTEEKVRQLDKILEESLQPIQSIGERKSSSDLEYADQTKQKLTPLLQMVEVESPKDHSSIPEKITVQDYFNDEFLDIIKSSNSGDKEIIMLEERMNKVIESINRLLLKRNKKEEIRVKIEKIQSLFNAFKENDKKIRGRQYCSDLLNSNYESFKLLMDNCNGSEKLQLITKIEQLNSPNLSKQMLYSISRATAIITQVYRVFTPQKLQDTVITKIPTLDSECKVRIKDLARACISTLNQEYSVTDREIAILNHQLSNENLEVEQLIAQESTANLVLLVKANTAARDALRQYRGVAEFLNDTVWHINVIKESTRVLDQFIHIHDGFLVRLSNLFAQISILFKSDTAAMIDRAREMKEHLAGFNGDYKNELAKELNRIMHHPDINQELKTRLQQKIGIKLTSETRIIPFTSPSKAEVEYLTRSLEELFNMKSESGLPERNEPLSEVSLSPSQSY
ncbi:purine NTPase [Legionella antarctica]|uniref:Purine NTPase n=1 Tax=Legionella antarctica TaxID=2708020 RepID=A0A6F8T473_9GAMM|nr:hypothetical protein [Legionella antarctica]BCA94822.1 purine NTPase [Legionella antarctica]